MKKYFFILFLFCSFLTKANSIPDTVDIGAYVLSVHDINFRDKEYTMRFWLWMLYDKEGLNPIVQTEIPNAKTLEHPDILEYDKDNKKWIIMKMKAIMKQAWKVNDYPFDKQELKIRVENTEFENQDLIFRADTNGSAYDPELAVDGWTITNFKVNTESHDYLTTFGDIQLPDQVTKYSTFNIYMTLERNAWGLFLKIFVGMYIGFLISGVSFLIHPNDVEARFALPVGGLFSAVGNKYIIDSILPESSSFSLVDSLHSFTFFIIFIIVLSSSYVLWKYRKGKIQTYQTINRKLGFIVVILYAVVNISLVCLAIWN